ncbi:MAG: hypothetical protein KIS88_06355 [Anaerolineales bacterium]|nr:hypothetical protein [Anaerolineales bacterium]
MKLFGKLFVFLALMSLLLAACGGGDPTPEGTLSTPEVEATTASEEAAEVESGSLCSVPYMPVSEGASWSYQGTGETGPFSWTTTASNVSDTGFTVTQTHDTGGEPLIVTQQWSCADEGVIALEYGGGADASLSYTGLNATLETLQTTGITMPRDTAPGDNWQQSFQLQGTVTTADIVSDVAGSVTQAYQAMAIESVSTPAGVYDALKVEVVTTFDLQMTLMGITVPFSMVSTNTTWFAHNVGWVKSTGNAEIDGAAGFENTIELQSYSIP